MSHPHDQSGSRVRLEWGAAGAGLLTPRASLCVVVDVLSFTTTVGVAVECGTTVFPYAWADATAETFAASVGATLAAGRRAVAAGQVSLSPASIRAAAPLDRLVLPSPNGSTISRTLSQAGAEVLAGSLRNRRAVGAAIDRLLRSDEIAGVALVPAGERWPDGSLRPAVEDLWGAGAVAASLQDLGHQLSEEAGVAAAAFRAVRARLSDALHDCASGRELVEGGFADDVVLAAELDASDVVPVLTAEGAFVAG